MRRCRWCGRFVRADQEPTTRTLTVGEPRTVQQVLCPVDAEAWSRPTGWNHDPDWSLPVDVLA